MVVALRLRVADDVHRVAVRPVGRQVLVEVFDRGIRQRGHGEPEIGGAVRRHHAGAAAVGDDGKAVAGRTEAERQRPGCGEQMRDGLHAHDADAADGGVEHVVRPDQRGGVRHRGFRTGGMASDLDQDNRLDARGGAQRAHEAARVADAFDVHQDAVGVGVGDEEIEDLAEVHVGGGAHRNDAGKSDIVAGGPVQDGGAQRAGLRDEGDVAGVRRALVEGGVQPDGGAHDAEAVGADQSDVVAVRGLHQLPLQRGAGRAGLAETGGDDDRRFHAVDAAVFEDAGHALRRGGDHHQLDRLADLGDGGIGALSLHHGMAGVDRIQRALEAALQHVLEHDLADRVGAVAGAENGHRFGCEQGIEIVLAHDIALPPDGLLGMIAP